MIMGTNPYINLASPQSAMDIEDQLEGKNGVYVDESYDYYKEEINVSIRKGVWSSEEDSTLISYISLHGEGHWNHLARDSGLNRTGKSCRMRWKNYLHPNIQRGNFTTYEQLRIIELQSFFGNRWSKIAEFLPGRTDNEIKNYWRTRVQKQAKQLNYDINSKEFKDFTRNIWLPNLSEQIYASKFSNNNLVADNLMTNFEGVESTMADHQPLQMDDNYWTTSFASSNGFSATDNLSDNNGRHSCFSASPMDCNLVGCAFQEADDPNWFSTYGELSDILLRDDCFLIYP